MCVYIYMYVYVLLFLSKIYCLRNPSLKVKLMILYNYIFISLQREVDFCLKQCPPFEIMPTKKINFS
jgi:hypothetical protein